VKRLIALLLIVFVGCQSSSYDYSQIKVVEVIDGDTVRLENGELLRYIGIDTPEVHIRNARGDFDYRPQPFSLEAKEANQSLVEGKYVRVEFDVEKRDKYKRLLGYCFQEDTFVNATLLKEGYALLYTYPPNVKYVSELTAAQKVARKEKRGIWESWEAISSDDAHQYINQIRTVRGTVASTYQSKKCVFLNFGDNYKDDFTIVIFNRALSSFHAQGIDPVSYYHGKTVQATGLIKEYNGPEIIVRVPEEVEVLE